MLHVLALTAVVLAAPPPAADEAATLARARELFTAGQKSFKQARYAEALARFEETWALRPHPSIQYNIGKCHEQLGDAPRALRAYREYLRLEENAPDRAAVDEAIARLDRRLREQGLQVLEVTADKPGALVSVDGAEVGPAPLTVALPVGVHRVGVRAAGFEPFEKAVALQLSKPSALSATLTPVPEVVADAPRLEPSPVLVPSPSPAPAVVVADVAPKPRVWTYVAGGVAAVGAGVAVGLLVGAQGNAAQLKSLDPARTRSDADALYSGYSTMMTGSHIAWAIAGTAAATALVLLFVEK
jgi:hypothetical protein